MVLPFTICSNNCVTWLCNLYMRKACLLNFLGFELLGMRPYTQVEGIENLDRFKRLALVTQVVKGINNPEMLKR